MFVFDMREVQVQVLTFAFDARAKDLDATGLHSRLHVELGGEVWHILATVADGDGVGTGIQGDVGDCVGAVAIVLDVNLGLCAVVRDDLDGQLSGTSVGAVHHELARLTHLGSLQTGT